MTQIISNMTPRITAWRALSHAWILLLDNYPLLLFATCMHAIRNVAVGGVILFFTVDNPLSVAMVVPVVLALSVLSYLEIVSICLKKVRGESVRIRNVSGLRLTVSWIVSTILFLIAIAFGLLLLVIPGFLICVLFSLYGFSSVDGDGPIQALKSSWKTVRGAFWPTLCVWLICLIPAVLFSSPTLFGLEIALDLELTLALAFIYANRRAQLTGGNLE